MQPGSEQVFSMEASPQNAKVSHVTKCKGDPNMWKAGMCSVPVANVPVDFFMLFLCRRGQQCNSVCYKEI